VTVDKTWFVSMHLDSGVSLRVCSTEHACKTAYEAWVDYRHAEFQGDGELIEVEGFDESVTRAPMKVGVLASSVVSVMVGKY
jgi:hypothetical protein